MPTIEEKLPQLTKAKVFTILDVSFHTVVMDEESSLLTTFQGPNGRYCYTRISHLGSPRDRRSINGANMNS